MGATKKNFLCVNLNKKDFWSRHAKFYQNFRINSQNVFLNVSSINPINSVGKVL